MHPNGLSSVSVSHHGTLWMLLSLGVLALGLPLRLDGASSPDSSSMCKFGGGALGPSSTISLRMGMAWLSASARSLLPEPLPSACLLVLGYCLLSGCHVVQDRFFLVSVPMVHSSKGVSVRYGVLVGPRRILSQWLCDLTHAQSRESGS